MTGRRGGEDEDGDAFYGSAMPAAEFWAVVWIIGEDS